MSELLNPRLNNKNWQGKKKGERYRKKERERERAFHSEKNSTSTKSFLLLSYSKEGWTNDEAGNVAKYRHLEDRLLKLN